MNKHILTLFLSLTLLLSLAACGGNADTTDARRDANEIVVGIAQDLENSLDPYTSVTAANREVLFNVFEGLVKPDADRQPEPRRRRQAGRSPTTSSLIRSISAPV